MAFFATLEGTGPQNFLQISSKKHGKLAFRELPSWVTEMAQSDFGVTSEKGDQKVHPLSRPREVILVVGYESL